MLNAEAYIQYHLAHGLDYFNQHEKSLIERFATTYAFHNFASMVDIGAGFGKSALLLSELLDISYTQLYLIEPDQILFESAIKSALLMGCHFINAKVEEVNFSQYGISNIDLVFSNMVFHFLDDLTLYTIIQNCSQIIAPNGLFAFTVPHPSFKQHKYGRNKVITSKAPWGEDITYHSRTTSEYLNMCTKDTNLSLGNIFEANKRMMYILKN